MAKQNYVWVKHSLGQQEKFGTRKSQGIIGLEKFNLKKKIKEKSEFLDCKDIQVWRLLYYVILWNIKALTFIWSTFCLTGSVL